MTHDALADELVSQLPLHRDTRWTAGSLGLDEAAFDAVAQRLLELETLGAIKVPKADYHKIMEPLLGMDADFFAFDGDPERVLALAMGR